MGFAEIVRARRHANALGISTFQPLPDEHTFIENLIPSV
jgi:hypothetical protein